MVLWSKLSTLDRMVEGSNPAAANFSFEVNNLDARRMKEDGNKCTYQSSEQKVRARTIKLYTKLLLFV